MLLRGTQTDPLSCATATTRPTPRISSICSHQGWSSQKRKYNRNI